MGNMRAVLLDEAPTEHEFCSDCDTALDGVGHFVTVQKDGNPPMLATPADLCEDCADKAADAFESREHHIWTWYARENGYTKNNAMTDGELSA